MSNTKLCPRKALGGRCVLPLKHMGLCLSAGMQAPPLPIDKPVLPQQPLRKFTDYVNIDGYPEESVIQATMREAVKRIRERARIAGVDVNDDYIVTVELIPRPGGSANKLEHLAVFTAEQKWHRRRKPKPGETTEHDQGSAIWNPTLNGDNQ